MIMFDSLLFQEYLAIALPTASCQLSNVGDMLVCPQPAVQLLFDSFAFEKTRQLIQLLLGAGYRLLALLLGTRTLLVLDFQPPCGSCSKSVTSASALSCRNIQYSRHLAGARDMIHRCLHIPPLL